ncbi:putative G-protein coupled receptor No18 [Holothuria leucospilota]|uniref:G-protein coupled receptor No18 n=1 Tax=Holothuria leucospilota TaxID=206669 RepID=A0A9Q1C3J8_HOLLE|nr:putative G-protein coupled receptor No18 [Holothuria leucospilota]
MEADVSMCIARKHWLVNMTEREGIDYHRHSVLFFVEVLSLLIIMVVANVANISVLIGILRLRTPKTKLGDILVLNLTIADLMASIGSMPFSFLDLFLKGYLICYPSLCTIHASLALFSGFGNFFAVSLISLYRCLRILAPTKIMIRRKHVITMIACAWLFTGVFSIPPVFGSKSGTLYSLGTHHCSPSASVGSTCLYQGLAFLFTYCVTIPTMVISYGLISMEVKKSTKHLIRHRRGKYTVPCDEKLQEVEGASLPGKDTTHNETSLGVSTSGDNLGTGYEDSYGENVSQKYDLCTVQMGKSGKRRKTSKKMNVQNKVALAGALLILTTVICWTPYIMVHWCALQITPSHSLEVFTMWLAYTNAALDPIIYTAFNKELRSAIIRPVRLLKCNH